jgi:alpha-1,3-fucosyltransferase 10
MVYGEDGVRRPLILFYNDVFGVQPWAKPKVGDIGCDVTADRARAAEADAVVLHVPSLPRPRQLRHIAKHPRNLWVLWSMESSVNYPMLTDRHALRHFDIRMTYERDADVWMPYLPDRVEIDALRERELPVKSEAAPLVLFQSAPIDRCGRYPFAAELMRHVRTDSYGRQLNNRTMAGPDLGSTSKLATIQRYKFTLALENSIAPDYVTEKFFDPLLAGSVPVYRGAPNVAELAPGPKSYIDAADFRGPKELADYLCHLDQNAAAYGEFFNWRKNPEKRFLDALEAVAGNPFVRLGRVLRERVESGGIRRLRTIYPFSRARWTVPSLRRVAFGRARSR